jgi:hypothetical protein
MPTNDIKAFATGVGANVLSQAEYAALTTLLANGFQAGIAKSQELNKVWRQSSFIAASFAKFIVDQAGVDVLDDGDVAGLTTKFVTALTALVQSASPKSMLYCGASTGSANAQVLAPSPAITAYGVGVPGYIFVAGYTNTTALFVNISGVGPVEVRKDSPSGLVALTGGEVHVGAMCLLRYDGSYLRLEDSQLGTAALMNASSGTPGGTVASVSGSTTVGHLAVFTDISGTVGDGGPVPVAPTVGAAGALDIGQGLEDDGSGNLRAKLADESLSRGASGLSVASRSLQVVGTVRNGKMSVTAASASATYTADEVTVAASLGGAAQKLANYSKTINLATTGAGGMDTGTAPLSGFVSLYAIAKNDGTQGVLACNVTTSSGPVYAGANMPAGYTMSALVGIWPTDGTGKFIIGFLVDRTFSRVGATALSGGTASSYTSVSLTSIVPAAATSVFGSLTAGYDTASAFATVAGASTGIGRLSTGNTYGGASARTAFSVPIITAQTVYYFVGAGSNTSIEVCGYTF